ncbi:thiamine pyrophosphate-binding protein [Micromonospora sicca]|uniref:Thiamine pyrophosphate-binding protein n=1 Tax=Micromonospora sicca TaxID=2202420 RepID=A0A317DFR7_9ACTN|nr:thiamine pyrophosphate-binding protein [Micromonospora sp. 4G51]
MAMSTAQAASVIAAHRPPDAVVISTMSSLRQFPRLSPSPLNLSCVPLMGGASALGLGIAIAQPNRSVLLLDGDGSLLMQLGSLVTVAGVQPRNLYHFVFDNGVWFEGGANFALPAADRISWTGLATAAGYAATYSFSDPAALASDLDTVLAAAGPCLIRLDIDKDAADRTQWSGVNLQEETPDSQFSRMGDEARTVMRALQQSQVGQA